MDHRPFKLSHVSGINYLKMHKSNQILRNTRSINKRNHEHKNNWNIGGFKNLCNSSSGGYWIRISSGYPISES